jgi:hypothetical protein
MFINIAEKHTSAAAAVAAATTTYIKPLNIPGIFIFSRYKNINQLSQVKIENTNMQRC